MIASPLRQFTARGRSIFVVELYNLEPRPLQFGVADIQAQIVNGQVAELKAIPYGLVREERTRQVAAAILRT
jgi:hypothetical protein